MLPSNMLDLSEPKTASVEGWSVSYWGNPSFKRRAGTDGFAQISPFTTGSGLGLRTRCEK